MDQVEILLIEDNAADVELFREALGETQWEHRLTHAWDGLAGLAILRSGAAATPPYRPDLILLDLNLPILSGREVLDALKADPRLANIPVAVTSGSDWERATLAAAGLEVASYLIKPNTWSGFQELAGRVLQLCGR